MGRGPKPAKSKDAKPPVARKRPRNEGSKVRDLEQRLAESQLSEKMFGELNEKQEYSKDIHASGNISSP